ncbi:MAG TPA: hypothetical protein VL625_08090 [Patescibacteria group bacterium]|jgi:hypothetical protein|nr:hypothetical protein [Patescibacteria group bacterium]
MADEPKKDDSVTYTPPEGASQDLVRMAEAANNASLYYEDCAKQKLRKGFFFEEDAPPLTTEGYALINFNGDTTDPKFLAPWKIFCANLINFYCDNPDYAAVFAPDTLTDSLGLEGDVKMYSLVDTVAEADDYLNAALKRSQDMRKLLDSYARKPKRMGGPELNL